VDMKKVTLDAIKPWIAQKVTELLGAEDDIVVTFAFAMLENEQFPDPKMMQLNLTGFLEAHSPEFMKELWKLLLSAQISMGGAPEEFLRKKREELMKKREEELQNVSAIQRTLKPSEAGYGLVGATKGEVAKPESSGDKDSNKDRDRDSRRTDRDRDDRRSDRDRSDRDRRDNHHSSERRRSEDDRHHRSRDDDRDRRERSDRRDRDDSRRDDRDRRDRDSHRDRRRDDRDDDKRERRHSRSERDGGDSKRKEDDKPTTAPAPAVSAPAPAAAAPSKE